MNEKPEALRLAELLNEATTVLDEPFHHNSIAENCDKAAAELRRLHAENERLREDAERYQWLRNRAWFQYEFEGRYGDFGETVQELDAAIDAALRQEQPK